MLIKALQTLSVTVTSAAQMIAEHGTSRSAAAAWIEWVDFNSRCPDALSLWQSLREKTPEAIPPCAEQRIVERTRIVRRGAMAGRFAAPPDHGGNGTRSEIAQAQELLQELGPIRF